MFMCHMCTDNTAETELKAFGDLCTLLYRAVVPASCVTIDNVNPEPET